jgi:hypothetical protein
LLGVGVAGGGSWRMRIAVGSWERAIVSGVLTRAGSTGRGLCGAARVAERVAWVKSTVSLGILLVSTGVLLVESPPRHPHGILLAAVGQISVWVAGSTNRCMRFPGAATRRQRVRVAVVDFRIPLVIEVLD